MAGRVHRGSWADSAAGAVAVALDEVRVDAGEYISCEYSSGLRLEPVDPEGRFAIDVELSWSEPRDQWRAVLRQVPALELEVAG